MAAGSTPLSFKSFHAQTGGGVQAFERYLTHWENATAAQLTSAFQPIAPSVGRAQAHSEALSEAAPLIKSQNAAFNNQTTGLSNAITGFGSAMQSYLAPIGNQIRDTYNSTGNALAGTNSAVRDIATGEGQGIQSQLAHFASVTGQPVADAGAAAAGARTGTANNLLGALGAGLSDENTLHGEAARLAELAKPSAFAAMGTQALSRGLGSLAATNNDNIAKINAEVPGEETKLYEAFLNRELQKAVAKATYDRNIYATNVKGYTAAAATAARARAAKTKVVVSTHNTDLRNWKAQNNSFTTKANSLLQSASRKQPAYKTVTDTSKPVGYKTTPQGLVPTYGTKTVKVGVSRPANYVQTRKQLINLAEHYLVGYFNPEIGRKMTAADARQAAIQFLFASGLYSPGQFGRPGAGGIDIASAIPPDLRPGG